MVQNPRISMVVTLSTVLAGSLLLASTVTSATPGIQGSKKERKCYKCDGTGKIESKTPPDSTFLYDSEFIRTDADSGVGFSVCPRTPTEAAKDEYEEIKTRNLKWLEKVEKFEEAVGDKAAAVEVEHLSVFLAIDKVKVDGKKLPRARAARRYAQFLSKVYDRYREIMGVEGTERGSKMRVVITKNQDAFSKYLKKYFGRGSQSSAGQKMGGSTFEFSTRKGNETDEDVEQRIVYSLGYLFVHKYYKAVTLPAWLHIGFGSWLEHDTYGTNKNFSFVEVPPDDEYKSGNDWRKRIKREVATGNIIQLAEIHDRDLNAFGYRDSAYAFTYVDFLIAHDQELFHKLLQRIKSQPSDDQNTMKAVLEVYGWLPAELNQAWRDWVKRKY